MDGGGIRGLLTTVILHRLQAALPGWLEQVDLLAGTSTGGIIALGLAYGLTPLTLRNLYYEKGPHIFADTALDDIADVGRLLGAEYDIEPLEAALHEIVGDTRLDELPRKVLISAFDLDNEGPEGARHWKAKFFHNFPGSDSDGARLAYQVALYTSAAPTYFPVVDGYVDGGVVANNPALAAVAQTQDQRSLIEPRPALGDIVLLSLGTGILNQYVAGDVLDWGYAQWARPLVNILLNGGTGVTDFQCRQLLDEKYHRVLPVLPRPIAMDGWRYRRELVQVGEQVDLQPTIEWLDKYWV
jgi:patatin-like phospholipase/acyl hydrolase